MILSSQSLEFDQEITIFSLTIARTIFSKVSICKEPFGLFKRQSTKSTNDVLQAINENALHSKELKICKEKESKVESRLKASDESICHTSQGELITKSSQENTHRKSERLGSRNKQDSPIKTFNAGRTSDDNDDITSGGTDQEHSDCSSYFIPTIAITAREEVLTIYSSVVIL